MRHGFQDDDACALCGQESETVAHLLLGCVFTKQVWFALLDPLQLATLMPERDEDVASWWLRQRIRVDSVERPLFDSMLLLAVWSLWKERNSTVFGRPASGVQAVVREVLREGEEWALGSFVPFVGRNM